MANRFSLLVFDLDGTLIDSKMDIARAVNSTLANFHLAPLSLDVIEKYVGTGVLPLLEKTLSDAGVTHLQKAREEFEQNYLEKLCIDTKLYEGINEVLEHFKSAPKIILTNKSNRFLIPLLKELRVDGLFEAAYGRESFAARKPDPLPLTTIAERHGHTPENILMIGDTTVDLHAGKSAGTKTCAVTYGYGDKAAMLAMNPTLVANRPLDLLRIEFNNS